MNSLHSISKPDEAKADVVFIHGLGGDQFKTWQHNSEEPDDSWPHWLSTERDQVGVHCLGYDAAPHRWLGEAMPLGDTAEASIATLIAAGIGERPLIMVGHSMGGLVIKQILRKVRDRRGIQKWQQLGASTKAVIFLGTPHRGAELATKLAHLGKFLGMSPAPTIDDLRRHSELLIDLNDWYGANTHDMGIETHCFYETVRTKGNFLPRGVVIVDKGSGDIDLPDVPSYPVAVDHIAICKPRNRDDSRCGYLLKLVDSVLKRSSSDASSQSTGRVIRSHTLPGRNPDFVGRQPDVQTIRDALLDGGAAITALEGMGGIGKTTLGVEVANQLQDDGVFPGGVVFLDLEGFSASGQALVPEVALARLIRAVEGSERKLPDYLAGLQQVWRQSVDRRKMLLFLDNARSEDQIRPLLPGYKECRVLVTSRHRLEISGVWPIELGLLSEEEAKLLSLRLGNRWHKEWLSEAQAQRLVALCGYHPLAIEVTAAALGKTRLLDVEVQLQKLNTVGKDLLRMGHVKAVLRYSLELLDPELRLKWQKLGVFEGDFAADAAAAVWAVESAEEDLADLEQRSLVTLDTQMRLNLHDVLRSMALEEIAEDEIDAVREWHASHYIDVLARANVHVSNGGTLEGLSQYDLESRQIRNGQRWAAEHYKVNPSACALAAKYLTAGMYLLHLRLAPKDLIIWAEVQIEASQRTDDRDNEGTAIALLSLAYALAGENRRSLEYNDRFLAIARELCDRESEGSAFGNIGAAYNSLGAPRQAIEFLQKSLEISREIGSRREEQSALLHLGLAYVDLGEIERGIVLYEQSLSVAREIGDRWWEGGCLGGLGRAHLKHGEPKSALPFLEQYLAISRELGDQRGEGYALTNLGVAYKDLGKIQRAATFFYQHLEIARAFGDRGGESSALINLGSVHAARGERQRSIELYEKALEISREIGDRRGEASARRHGAFAFIELGERAIAIAWAKEAATIYEAIEDPSLEEMQATIAKWYGDTKSD